MQLTTIFGIFVKTKKYLTLDDAKKIAAAAESMAHKNSWAVCIAIVDDGGHLLWFERLDNCAPSSVAIAQAKAYSAAIRRRPTKGDEDMVNYFGW
jgi:glc operon protein GlcG